MSKKTFSSAPALPSLSFVSPPHLEKPLFIPHRSRYVALQDWIPHMGRIKPEWHDLADLKGFRIHSRIRDRMHLVLECKTCGALTAQKLHTLRTANAACAGCQDRARTKAAEAAGLTFLGRDPEHCNYGFYRAGCGHLLRRSFVAIDRAMRGEVDTRCDTCLQHREAEEARRYGWERLSSDPDGDDNYRLYQHVCGHQQRVARVNMQWGQVDCAQCGKGWSARKSFLYLVRISWPDRGLEVIKLGYSANPAKRFKHQLKLAASAEIEILRIVAVPTGHMACRLEKQMHAALRRDFPAAIIPPADYAALINVVTEIYRPDLEEHIHALLDQVARDHGS